MSRLSPTTMLIAIGVAVAGMIAAAAAPALNVASLDARIAEQERRVAEKRTLLQKRLRVDEGGGPLAGDAQSVKQLLAGPSIGVAGANLQKLLSDLLTKHGGTIASIQVLPSKDEGELAGISARISLRVGIAGLRSIVHQLETGLPLIFIEVISMRAETKETQAADPYLRSPLEVTMQVRGYMRKQGGT